MTSARSPDVAAAAGLGRGAAASTGAPAAVTIVDPAALAAGDSTSTSSPDGSTTSPTATVAVVGRPGRSHGWDVGTPLPVTFADGPASTVRIAAIYDRPEIVGNVLIVAPHVGAARGAGHRRRPCWSPCATASPVAEAARSIGPIDRRLRQPGGRHAPGVHRRQRGGHRHGARHRLRAARPGRHHRRDGHRQHAVAVDPRAHPRARPAACGRAKTGAASARWCVGSR